ncbi:hypothetical protein ACKKBF_B41145 [Auxenochlorella protothecoides x Auxenochlorella symbiontica]
MPAHGVGVVDCHKGGLPSGSWTTTRTKPPSTGSHAQLASSSNSAAKTAGFLAVAGILHLSATSFFRLYELRVRSEMDAPV